MKRVWIIVCMLVPCLVVATVLAALPWRPHGMPEKLRGMPPEIRAAAAEIQKIVREQRGLAEKAWFAKTPQERQDIFDAVNKNVQRIAQQRVRIFEAYLERARARVAWAREHAAEVRAEDIVQALHEMKQQGPPRSPFEEEKAVSVQPGVLPSQLAQLPKEVENARLVMEKILQRLQTLRDESKRPLNEAERKKIRAEIDAHLHSVQQQRIAILEAMVTVAEQRLTWAKKQ